jgi:hypothetical protein
MPRQRRFVGAVLSVPLGENTRSFALTLPEADFAIFDARTKAEQVPANLLALPVLFRVAVHKSAWADGRWPRVGQLEVPAHLLAPQPKFVQDPLDPERFQIYIAGSMRPAARAECEGLERAAVWEPEHVEDRLRCHYKGVPCQWVQSLQPK